MNSKYALGFLFIVAALPFLAHGQPKYSTKVQVAVSGDDDSLSSLVKSYLSRNLRSLGDVAVVDEKVDYTFNILVNRLKLVNGELTGFDLSVLIAHSLDPNVSGAAFYTDMYMVVGPVLVVGYGLQVGGMNVLESTCQQ